MAALSTTFLVLLAAVGCVRRDGRNSDCKWPTEVVTHAPDAPHLSADAEFAEDLAIRYADTHHGLHTPYYVSREAYASARDSCVETLFEQIAKEHGVSLGQVSDSLGRNRLHVDLAEILPFVLPCCFAAAAAVRTIWRRYPPIEREWI